MGSHVTELDSVFSTLTEIMDSGESFSHKAEKILALGAEKLGVDHAHLTRVVPELKYWEVVASTDPTGGAFPVGETAALNKTYCRRTLGRTEPLALHDAPNQGWADDIAYKTHGLNTYLGTSLQLEGHPIGTICFVDKTARSEPFSETEIAFVDWLASMLLSEFKLQEQKLTIESHSRLVTVFNRILRHNLRNDLTVIRGHVDLLIEELEQPSTDPTQLRATLDRIITLAEKSKELRQIVERESTLKKQSVTDLVEACIETIEAEYPAATLSVNSPEDVQLFAYPSLQAGIYELLENAAKHASGSPRGTVTVESGTDAVIIEIADNGPGLPAHEQLALEGELGTSVNHSTGVGLWIVWWVVKSHGGTIQTSITETGTTIAMSIPRPSVNRQLIEQPQSESQRS